MTEANDPEIGSLDKPLCAGHLPNGIKIFAAPEDARGPVGALTMAFNRVRECVDELNRIEYLGYSDWDVATEEESDLLYAAIGKGGPLAESFGRAMQHTAGRYLTYSPDLDRIGFQSFKDGQQGAADPRATIPSVLSGANYLIKAEQNHCAFPICQHYDDDQILGETCVTKVSIFGVLSNIQMLIKTACGGTRVGVDQYGNVYYTGKPRGGDTLERRWVMYKEEAEASLIPPEWHGWLHHQTDLIPASNNKDSKPWQKPHQPNLTATDKAYFPPGDVRKGGRRDPATGDYIAWQPPQ